MISLKLALYIEFFSKYGIYELDAQRGQNKLLIIVSVCKRIRSNCKNEGFYNCVIESM